MLASINDTKFQNTQFLRNPSYMFIQMYTFILFLSFIHPTCLFGLHVYSEGESKNYTPLFHSLGVILEVFNLPNNPDGNLWTYDGSDFPKWPKIFKTYGPDVKKSMI